MIRNPWGTTSYNMDWHKSDSKWTTDYLSQVPHGINPTTSADDGIFFVEDKDFLKCFDDYQIAHYRDGEGYKSYWYDVDDDDRWFGSDSYFITPPAKSGDLYIQVETYFYGVMHPACHPVFGLPAYMKLSITQNGVSKLEKSEFQFFSSPLVVLESEYSAGDTFEVIVDFDWGFGWESHDYTVLVYSK